MPARKVIAPRPITHVQVPTVEDPSTALAVEALASAVQALQSVSNRAVVVADLVVGTNRIEHGLGRAARGYNVVPTTADAAFAHAIDLTNPRPDLEVWVTVVGVSQDAAIVEIF